MARSYRVSYKKVSLEQEKELGYNYFVKEAMEFHAYCGSRYENSEQNILLRLDKTLLKVIDNRIRLPKFIVVVLDDDFISMAKYTSPGISGILGNMLESLIYDVKRIVEKRKEQLPLKARRDEFPMIYWVTAPKHKQFGEEVNDLRVKFNLCMESIVKMFFSMRVIKVKEHWDYSDGLLVDDLGHLTVTGTQKYWAGVDVAIQFNAKKWDECRIRRKYLNLVKHQQETRQENSHNTRRVVFGRGRGGRSFRGSTDQYHWRKPEKITRH